MIITANELKVRGISAVDSAVEADGEAVITVRGERKYVVLDFENYNRLRELELESALKEARDDVASGRYIVETVEEHMKRVLE